MSKKPHIVAMPHMGTPLDVLVYEKEGDEKKPGKMPVGYFLIVLEGLDSAVIYYMHIDPNHKRKGYGKDVLDRTKLKTNEIKTQIASSSEESISFLKKQGFVEENGWLVWHKKT